MANIKSAEKRNRQAEKRRARNKAAKTRVRTAVKGYRQSDDPKSSLPKTYSEIDVARRKGVLHPSAAARLKSRLARKAKKA